MAELGKNLIGYGAAQVFDTSRSVALYSNLLQKKEKDALAADEKFMKSLSVDSKGLRSVDIPGYTKKYNEFVQWSADNQVDLKNPTKNPLVFQEFQAKKNELLLDISRSEQAKKKQSDASKTLINGREEFYNRLNVNAINNLSETDIYSDSFGEVLNFNLRRDTNKALSNIKVGELSIESDVPVKSDDGTIIQTKSYSVNEEALNSAVNNHFNQYSIEYIQDFASEEAAKEFIYNDIRSRIKKDKKETIKTNNEELNIGFDGGSIGDVNYDVVNLSGQDVASKYSDFGFQGAREISFGFIKGENKPITFTSRDGKETFEDVIPKAIIVDPETGRQGFVFYKPGKKLSDSERRDIIASKVSELMANTSLDITDDEANAQAREYVDALETGAEFSVSDVPKGQINVHYDNLYKELEKAGLFKASESSQEVDLFGNPI